MIFDQNTSSPKNTVSIQLKYTKDLAHQEALHWFYQDLSQINSAHILELKKELEGSYVKINQSSEILRKVQNDVEDYKKQLEKAELKASVAYQVLESNKEDSTRVAENLSR